MTSLVDTHQHLIYPEIGSYGWTDEIPALSKKSFTLENYQELANSQKIQASLFMEAGVDDEFYKDEVRYVFNLAKNPSNRIVGIIASCRPESDEGFEGWLDECNELNVVGYRRILHVMPDELSTTSVFRRNVQKIGNRGLVFDMCFLAKQLPISIELAKSCENTRLVLNHCGVPDIAGGGLDPWRKHISQLAELPNVYCKLSGLLAYCGPGNSTLESIKPYVDHVLESFGSERIVWGSDWPVVNLANGLQDWLSVTAQILKELSESDAYNIAQGTVQRIYKIKLTE